MQDGVNQKESEQDEVQSSQSQKISHIILHRPNVFHLFLYVLPNVFILIGTFLYDL